MVHRERAPAPHRLPRLQGDGRTAPLGVRAAALAAPRAGAVPGRGGDAHGDVTVGGGPLRGRRPGRPAVHGRALHDGARRAAGMEDRTWVTEGCEAIGVSGAW